MEHGRSVDWLARMERNAVFAARTAGWLAGWLTGCLSVIVRGCFPTDTRCSSAKKGAGETAASGLPWHIKRDRSRGSRGNGCRTIGTPDRYRRRVPPAPTSPFPPCPPENQTFPTSFSFVPFTSPRSTGCTRVTEPIIRQGPRKGEEPVEELARRPRRRGW